MNLLLRLVVMIMSLGFPINLRSADLDIPIPSLEEPMSFAVHGNGGNCDSCAWIMAQGVITPETPTAFKTFINQEQKTNPQFPYSLDVMLHSPGGSLSSGLELGHLIRELRLNTSVGRTAKASSHPSWERHPGICASACAYAFLGGRSRAIGDGSKYGVHQFSFENTEVNHTLADKPEASDTQAVAGFLAYYIHRMGADPSLLFLAGSAKSDEILFLNPRQMAEMHVTTADQDELVFKGWALEPYRQGVVAISTTANARGRHEDFSVFCRHDNPQQALVMVSARLWGEDNAPSSISAPRLREVISLTKITADNSTVRKSDRDGAITELRIDKDARVFVTTQISQSELTRILHSNAVEFSLELPHALNWRLGATTQIRSGLDHIRLALRNCI
jgi:hypothetical protein